MNQAVLIALVSSLIEDALANREIIHAKGRKGRDGRSFDFEEHREEIQSQINNYIEEIRDSLKGQDGISGKDGKDGKNGTSVSIEQCEEIIRSHIATIQDTLKLKFADLNEDDKAQLRGPRGQRGKIGIPGEKGERGDKGDSFNFELERDNIVNELKKMEDSLKLKFSDLTEDDKAQLKGPRGQRGKQGNSFDFETEKEKIVDSIQSTLTDRREEFKLKFSDLTKDEITSLVGPKGEMGIRGPVGLSGAPGRDGKNGQDGQDAPHVVDIKTKQLSSNKFVLIFIFSDGTSIETDYIDLPAPQNIFNNYVTSGSGSSYDREGQYSTRFDEVITATDVATALDQIFQFTSVNPTVVLTLSPSNTREKGDSLTEVTLTANSLLGQNPIGTLTQLVFSRGVDELTTVETPSDSETFVEANVVTDTTTFSATLSDSEGRVATNSKTISFVYPILYLSGAKNLTGGQIYSGATKILSSTTQRDITYNFTNEVVYYCYPASASAITQVFDINNFDVTSTFTYRDVMITGLDGTAQSYKVLEFNNLATGSMTYKFRN